VIFVFADSPAAKAGLKAGDVILSAGGETVENPIDIRRVLTDKSEGTIEIRIMRDKQEKTLNIKIENGTRSWLLEPDEPFDTLQLAISPATMALTPMTVQLPKLALKPMTIKMPKMPATPITIPQLRFAPMIMEIPRIKIDPMNVVIVPRRIRL
jgi:membrane-associated protease RseP (regulator of RpoE activity)